MQFQEEKKLEDKIGDKNLANQGVDEEVKVVNQTEEEEKN